MTFTFRERGRGKHKEFCVCILIYKISNEKAELFLACVLQLKTTKDTEISRILPEELNTPY